MPACLFGNVLISGANRGIGLEIVRQLSANDKNRIFAGCRNPDAAFELKELAEKHKNICILTLDNTKNADIENAVLTVSDETDHLNVLINNAGVHGRNSYKLGNQERDILQDHFNVNVTSCILMAKAFHVLLSKGTTAKMKSLIVNVSSILGSISLTQVGDEYHYRCSKTAMNMATKCLGNELAPDGIYCVAIHPGWVKTDMGGKAAPMTAFDSVKGILKFLTEVTEERNGQFVECSSGKCLPY